MTLQAKGIYLIMKIDYSTPNCKVAIPITTSAETTRISGK
jgi:hypothetical protein